MDCHQLAQRNTATLRGSTKGQASRSHRRDERAVSVKSKHEMPPETIAPERRRFTHPYWKRMTKGRRYFHKHITTEQSQQLLDHIDHSYYATEIPLGTRVEHDCVVVFFDLCNFTNISWSLTTVQVLAIIQELFVFVGKTVTQYNGMIDKYPGDGVVAFFPRNYEDDQSESVEQALDCVLTVMHWFYDKMRWHHDLPKASHELALAVGLDAGRISIAHVGSPVHSELILLGDQVNCASKCQQAAAEGEVVVGQGAAALAPIIYSRFFTTGPANGVVYTGDNSHYRCVRFDWRERLKSAGWINTEAR
jgi:class 3 adenylate cyclase